MAGTANHFLGDEQVIEDETRVLVDAAAGRWVGTPSKKTPRGISGLAFFFSSLFLSPVLPSLLRARR